MTKYLFLLSPSFSIYYQWKHLLKEINCDGHKIDIFIPKPLTYKNILPNLNIIQKDLNINKFLVLNNPLNPFSLVSLDSKQIYNLIHTRRFKLQLLIRNFVSRISDKLRINYISNLLDDFFRYICSVKFFRKISKKFLFSTKYNTLLYDVFEEKKYYIFPFLSYFYSLNRISLFHGCGISWNHYINYPIWIYTSRLLILDNTGLNRSLYNWSLIKKDINYKIIGLPTHTYEKKQLLQNSNKLRQSIINFLGLEEDTKFITLASRPDDNNWCSSIDRKLYLKEIGKFLVKNKEWHLLIRAHPKEGAYDELFWGKLLDLPKDINSISITNKTILELASISDFGFSFVSDSCIDFSSFGHPMIELTSLDKTKFSMHTPYFNIDGLPNTAPAEKNLAINVKNISELNEILNNIPEKIRIFSKQVSEAYQSCYGKYPYKKGMILDTIKQMKFKNN